MFKMEKEKTGSSPYIYVDEEKGYMRFLGESFHENVLEVYSDIIKWLQKYAATDFASFTFDCELKYFNSSTAKMLLNILLLLDEASKNGRQVTVKFNVGNGFTYLDIDSVSIDGRKAV